MRAATRIVTGVGVGAMLLAGFLLPGSPTGSLVPDTSDRSFEERTAALSADARAQIQRVALQSFDGCDELLGYFRDQAAEQVQAYGLPWGGYATGGVFMFDRAVAATAESADAAGPPSAAPGEAPSFSTTNVQESGVDEPDTVETDGEHIYFVRGDQLIAVRAAGLDVTDRIRLKNSWGAQLLLAGDRLLVIEPQGGPVVYAESRFAPEQQWRGRVALRIVDVSDPSNLETVETLWLEGQYVSARMVDGIARVVVRTSGPAIEFASPDDGSPASQDRALATNRARIERSTLDEWLPRYMVTAGESEPVDGGEPIPSCGDVRHPPEFSGLDMVSVITVDPADPTPGDAATVVGAGDTVYASTTGLYVTSTEWNGDGGPIGIAVPRGAVVVDDVATSDLVDVPADEPGSTEPGSTEPGAGGGSEPSEPEPDVLEPETREKDETQPVEPEVAPAPGEPSRPQRRPEVTTKIHLFDISDPVRSVYRASGEVDGMLLNQWSLSEYDGSLRVVTTTGQFDGKTVSGLTVLQRRGQLLAAVGAVGGLGKNESVYAVRFIGDQGYVVTFRQIDPLYVLDLSDPENPRVRGELKIPGFSSYLHPVADGRLFGLGQDASLQGRVIGVQASLFDVSDPADPRQVDVLPFARGTYSNAQNDHHAFLWWAERDLAIFPIGGWDERDQRYVSGAVAVHVDGDRLVRAGTIEHPYDQPATQKGAPFTEDAVLAQGPEIERSLVIGDTLYTVSYLGLMASSLDDLAELDFLRWPGQ